MLHLRLTAGLVLLYASPLLAQQPPAAASWLVADSAAKTINLTLDVAGAGGGPSATINGQRNGSVQIIVPLNWTVTWHWRSSDTTSTHSLVLMAEREKLPLQGDRPALQNAMTRMVTAGLKAGQTDVTTFTADGAAGIGSCAVSRGTRSVGNGLGSAWTQMRRRRPSRKSAKSEQ